ncbi:SAM-dependent methyltransferase [Vibrio mangrovi]|uniref:Cyclopropane mycolic acid synthase 1 n=1 Tax=Vibrio mangrovi TaxID=474394 RepID=A0A1Y6J004_9VIBR|nr:cyclopropane-fatty-acyl-phospholipid synthase family protein [Vibrio mangrovi]MDW6005486.1 cyclopropane-fatty-acyl-phospholipid synthase family protein [Vibrio mangrovi]SMS02072.1 Cyclopropane mycolic acid synthase 1 [Vibrio mangrovi]
MFWERKFEKFIDRISDSQSLPMTIQLWNGREVHLTDEPKVVIEVPHFSSLKHLINPSLDKLGHAYVEGKLHVKGKVMDVVEIANQLVAYGSNYTGKHGGSRRYHHTRKLDSESISYHYDVSNEFYQAWLDKNMVYSCGYFKTMDDSLDLAQEQKIDHILNKIQLQPGQTLLDVGCGWGALIIRAAQKFGAKATGITISEQQYLETQKRIRAAGLESVCEVHLLDYRDVHGTFDRITSVGMFEHVGLKHLNEYFSKLNSLLAEDGVMMNHGITTTDPKSGSAPSGAGKFIDRYVFPNGELPHIGLVLKEMAIAGLEPVDIENLRHHYAMTLEHWAARFEAQSEQLKTMVDDKQFRIWRVYLAGCAHAFHHNWVALHQIVATKADRYVLPLTRDYMYHD